MRSRHDWRRWLAIGLLALTARTSAAAADQADPRLVDLFAQLRAADAEAAAAIEAQIWHIWLQSGRSDVDTLITQGVAQMNSGEYDAALGSFDQAVAAAPDYAEGWNKRATVLFLLKRYADSVRDIDRVLALEPRHFGALSGLGLCDTALHDDVAALRAFERSAAIDPSQPGVLANIAALKRQMARERI